MTSLFCIGQSQEYPTLRQSKCCSMGVTMKGNNLKLLPKKRAFIVKRSQPSNSKCSDDHSPQDD
ncbi:hypothetical protein DFA_06926 [Cavenderia fasciculata]|uniref:Uncharacterized protein n=1 Tax=Cavenderia fasciculata TaxID=261658 RepID=F4PX21_CACFS|nr:uncharacterized protein DFA_06926 [Cavenderia fasciculata]EGG19824.1 hypothetical protein DFA_06926 [Cavenderia fasciculata]|eukprot:XP_004358170.1 hypothetical protein DFA_06926 [Cavenderia fasciculata]